MKVIVAYIRPDRMQQVKTALFARKIFAMSATNILGAGQQKGYTEMYRGVTTQVTLLKKVRIELCLEDAKADEAMAAIMEGAKTGHEGDGIMYVLDACKGVRIRTGEALA